MEKGGTEPRTQRRNGKLEYRCFHSDRGGVKGFRNGWIYVKTGTPPRPTAIWHSRPSRGEGFGKIQNTDPGGGPEDAVWCWRVRKAADVYTRRVQLTRMGCIAKAWSHDTGMLRGGRRAGGTRWRGAAGAGVV